MCTLNVLPAAVVALLQLLDDVRLAGGREERRQPVVVLHDLVRDDAGRDLARPAHQQRDTERALPVRVLLAAERRHRAVRPRVHVRPVVGRVHHDRVVGDPELVEQVEQLADVLVVVDHRVVVGRLPAAGLADALRFVCVRRCMWVVLTQQKNGLRRLCWRRMKSPAAAANSSSHVSIRLRVSGPVSSIRCLPTRPQRGCSFGSSLSVAQQRSTPRGPNRSWNSREAVLARVVRVLRVLLGVQVVEVAEELVEPVDGRQELVLVPEVVLAELRRSRSRAFFSSSAIVGSSRLQPDRRRRAARPC